VGLRVGEARGVGTAAAVVGTGVDVLGVHAAGVFLHRDVIAAGDQGGSQEGQEEGAHDHCSSQRLLRQTPPPVLVQSAVVTQLRHVEVATWDS